MDQLSVILQNALTERNLSQSEAAQLAEIERKTFNSYVLGRTEPDLPTLKKIIKVLRIEKEITALLMEQNVPERKISERSPTPSTDFLAGKLAVKDEVIAEKEARRADAEAHAQKMEKHYNDMKEALERSQLAINDFLKPMAASLKDIPPVLDVIVRNSHEHDKEIMKALDHLVGNQPGTLEKESGKRILKGALEQQKKGKADVGKQG